MLGGRRRIESRGGANGVRESCSSACSRWFRYRWQSPPVQTSSPGSRSHCCANRCADAFLGVPFNIASYALLAHLFAQPCDLEPGELVWTGGDCHLYLNHLEQAELQLSRTPFAPPRLSIRRRPPSIFDYRYEDFEFADYQHHAPIRAPVAV